MELNLITKSHRIFFPFFFQIYDFQMGSRSPQQNIWGSSSRCHRLSDGLHSIPSSLSIWQGQMTEYTLPTTKSINKTMSETNFMDTRFARKYSYVSTD